MGIRVTLTGVNEAKRAFSRFRIIRGVRIRDEVQRAGERIRDRAAKIVRVDTGALRGSIKAQSSDLGFTVSVGSDSPYAAAQEYGLPGKRYSYTPYLRPAYNAEKERFLSNIREIISA